MITETPLLLLREMNEKDLPDLREILQDPVAMTAYEGAFDEAMVLDWLDRQLQRYARDGMGLWALVEKATGEMVGQCGLTWQDCGRGAPVPEVGYLLQRDAWHKGYATEGAIACRDHAFTALGFQEVYSIIRDNNLPSQAVARRNGMEVRGSFVKHYHGVDMPHLIFSVRRSERGNG